jgi:hypothetical protein
VIPKEPQVPKDGARFRGSVRMMPNGEWRANCYWRCNSSPREEEAQSRSFDCEGNARDWIQVVGATRGFKSMVWE